MDGRVSNGSLGRRPRRNVVPAHQVDERRWSHYTSCVFGRRCVFRTEGNSDVSLISRQQFRGKRVLYASPDGGEEWSWNSKTSSSKSDRTANVAGPVGCVSVSSFKELIGIALREGLTQKGIGDLCRVQQGQVSKWKSGNAFANVDQVKPLLDRFGHFIRHSPFKVYQFQNEYGNMSFLKV